MHPRDKKKQVDDAMEFLHTIGNHHVRLRRLMVNNSKFLDAVENVQNLWEENAYANNPVNKD